MMFRRGAATLVAAAFLLGACSTGGGASYRATDRHAGGHADTGRTATPATPRRPRLLRPRRLRRAAAQVEINWYHIQNNDPGKTLWQTLADEYMADQSRREGQRQLPRERGLQDQADDAAPGHRPRPTCSSRGVAADCASRPRPDSCRTSLSAVAPWADTINPGAMGMYQVDGKQYGIPFDLGMVGFWYNKQQFADAGHYGPAGDMGRVPG